ncbi:MAG: peptidase M1 [Flavobacterium sp. BFFFF2]|nr:MAG: peptidase M1 [Flavobacterium sp. BFFFF2]
MNLLYKIIVSTFFFAQLQAQQTPSHCDSLLGGWPLARSCYNVLHYDLNLRLQPKERSISGYNRIKFQLLTSAKLLQLDLAARMEVDSLVYNQQRLAFTRDCDALLVQLSEAFKPNESYTITAYFHGKPIVAKNAPWDGGFVFKDDGAGHPWIGVAVQGIGASQWFPVKDSQADEPDLGVHLAYEVPSDLLAIGNGQFEGETRLTDGFTRYNWLVTYPINAYDITLDVGDYVTWSETYKGLKMSYYVLRGHEALARKQFEQARGMLDCFQEKIGPYPFARDGYKLVETPFLGMEHQSAVAYGNQFRNGYLGTDLSDTGIGLRFDFIIIHESAHEWFGNSITSSDIADMWIHEGFTTYAESMYIECLFGREDALSYEVGQRSRIDHDRPILGRYGIHEEGSSDMYNKGAALVQTLRTAWGDEVKWALDFKKFYQQFQYKIITTTDVIQFFETAYGHPVRPVFMEYLEQTTIPELQFKKQGKHWMMRWNTVEKNFELPVEAQFENRTIRLKPTNNWQKVPVQAKKAHFLEVDTRKSYVKVKWVF